MKENTIILSPSTYTYLTRVGKTTIGDLLSMTESDLRNINGIGIKSAHEVLTKVSSFKEKNSNFLNFSHIRFLNEGEEKKKEKKKIRFVLIKTDGYSISSWFYGSYDEGKREMDKQYSSFCPEELEEEWADMSYCDTHDAILYDNGENVYVWKICEIPN